MIRFSKKLYTSDSIKMVGIIKKRIVIRSGMISIYLLALNNGSDQLEYFHNSMLKQKAIWKQEHYIVGMAKSVTECQGIVERIASDCYSVRGDYDMKSYLCDLDKE